jgi:hypothetical protein
MKKGAIELSLNFLIIIIISVIILAFGINFVRKMVGGVDDIVPNLDQSIIKEIEKITVGNNRVAIVFNSQEIRRGQSHLFGLGIKNAFPTPDDRTFDVSYSFRSARDPSMNNILNPKSNFDIKTPEPEITIDSDQRGYSRFWIIAKKNATPGEYIIDVTVENNNIPYGDKAKIFISVP